MQLRAVLSGPSGTQFANYSSAVPKRYHDKNGFVYVTGGNWTYSEAPWQPTVDKIAKAVESDHLDKKAYEKVVTEEQFMAKERKNWVEERRPPEEFDHPPMYRLPGNGSVIPASGQMPTVSAMKSYCAQHSCDFGVMLGDNIYPDGAMADADDAKRVRDV
mgnify:CR=1 FL=1